MHPTLPEKLQGLIDKAINILYGITDDNKAWINKKQAMVELGIPPLYATAAAAVARGRGKFNIRRQLYVQLPKGPILTVQPGQPKPIKCC